MRRLLQWLGGLVGVAVLLVLAVQGWYFRPFAIGIFFERAFIQFVLEDPEAVSSLGVFEQLGYKGFDGMLTDVSPAHQQKLAQMARDDLATLHGYDRSSLSPSHQLSYDVLEWFLQDLVDGQHWLFHDYPVNQLFGVQSSTPEFMVQIHPIGDQRDVNNYISRLTAFERKFDQLLQGLRLRQSMGVVPPKFVIERVLVEMRAFIAVPARDNILYTNLRDKMGQAEIGVGGRSGQAAGRSRKGDRAQGLSGVWPAHRVLRGPGAQGYRGLRGLEAAGGRRLLRSPDPQSHHHRSRCGGCSCHRPCGSGAHREGAGRYPASRRVCRTAPSPSA